MHRDLNETINSIINVIPKDKDLLITILNNQKNVKIESFIESQSFAWNALREKLINNMGLVPEEEWEYQVWAIFSDQPIEDVKIQVEEYKKSKVA